MPYEIRLHLLAERSLRRLPNETREKIDAILGSLAVDPHQGKSEVLHRSSFLYGRPFSIHVAPRV